MNREEEEIRRGQRGRVREDLHLSPERRNPGSIDSLEVPFVERMGGISQPSVLAGTIERVLDTLVHRLNTVLARLARSVAPVVERFGNISPTTTAGTTEYILRQDPVTKAVIASSRFQTFEIGTAGDSAILIQTPSTGDTTTDGLYLGLTDAVPNAYLWNYENGLIGFGAKDQSKVVFSADGGFIFYLGDNAGAQVFELFSTTGLGAGVDQQVFEVDSLGNVTLIGTVDGRDVAADGIKLDGIEAGATADQTAAEIKTAYESNANTNEFSDAEQTKLLGIEAGADVTDATNVNAAGAVMETDTAGGDLGGTYPNPTVVALQAAALDALTEIAAALKQGDGSKLQTITTAGVDGRVPKWDAGGKLADSTKVAANLISSGDAAGGDLTGTYPDPSIAANAVSNAKAADMAQSTLKGRASGAGTGDPTDLTAAQARTVLNVADGANNYVHPNHSGHVTSVADGATTIQSGVITLAMFLASVLQGNGSKLQTVTTAGASGRVPRWDAGGKLEDSTKVAANLVSSGDVAGGSLSGTYPSPTLAADAVDAITEIAAALKSGADATLVTGTAGTADNLAKWNSDGDIVDSTSIEVPVANQMVFVAANETISGGVLTLNLPSGLTGYTGHTRWAVQMDPQADTDPLDDLDSISGGQVWDIAIIKTRISGDTITVKHLASKLAIGSDRVLNNPRDVLVLMKVSATLWVKIDYSDNA